MNEAHEYNHLTLPSSFVKNIDLVDGHSHNRVFLFFKKKLLSLQLSEKILKRLAAELNTLLEIIKAQKLFHQAIYNLKKDALDAHEMTSSYGYSNSAEELGVALKYKKQLEKGLDNIPAESGELYKHTILIISNLLSKDPSIKEMLNFGVSLAYTDNLLAKKHPTISFIGIDRSRVTKSYNEELFSSIPNMEFLDGDIFSLLENRKFEDGIFFHSRTLLLLPKAWIEKLYRSVKDAGFKYIVGMEQIGLSRQTRKPYYFSESDQDSVVYRSFMYIHNYPGILKKCGFQVIRTELLKTAHPHEDFRILSFTATPKCEGL